MKPVGLKSIDLKSTGSVLWDLFSKEKNSCYRPMLSVIGQLGLLFTNILETQIPKQINFIGKDLTDIMLGEKIEIQDPLFEYWLKSLYH